MIIQLINNGSVQNIVINSKVVVELDPEIDRNCSGSKQCRGIPVQDCILLWVCLKIGAYSDLWQILCREHDFRKIQMLNPQSFGLF